MSSGVAFVFLAMIEFAIVNTLARKEIRRMSIKVRTEQKDNSGDLVSGMRPTLLPLSVSIYTQVRAMRFLIVV